MENSEKSKLQNKELLDKVENYKDVIESLEKGKAELETQIKEFQENNDKLISKYDQVQDELSKVTEDSKFSLQMQAVLEEQLNSKEKESENIQKDLASTKLINDKNIKEINLLKEKLAKTQQLLRNFHVKKVNWANFYSDLEADYYRVS